jgi:LmbE family N-acetylglucosaminyl deacetylase
MKLSQPSAEVWVPDGVNEDGTNEKAALGRVTHLAIAAHPDDVEIMALDGILAGFGNHGFMAVIATNGAGSPRAARYANYTDEQMQLVRRLEQKKAGFTGEYSAIAFLDHSSAGVTNTGLTNTGVKNSRDLALQDDLKSILTVCQPEIIYTHNLADKHDTHVAVALQTIAAIRALPKERHPKKLYGCEVWRGLDWLVDTDKIVFNVSQFENMATSLLGVFDSQIAGGKHYDLATLGRRRANATFLQSHAVDAAEWVDFAMELTPLIQNPQLDPGEYIQTFIQRFAEDVNRRIQRFSLTKK